jgi:2-polyprenyl-3-methyl-5-hydroxy-6-metoxy-1,4-benzoquinol methylase
MASSFILQGERDDYELDSKNPIGFIFAQLKPLPAVYQLFPILAIKKDARILDVGSGGGPFLDFLASKGFRNLNGADPFNQSKIVTENGAAIEKRDIHSINQPFDVIMFHPSLENVTDPAADIQKAHDLLSKNGICIVRIPTSSSPARKKYQENWI